MMRTWGDRAQRGWVVTMLAIALSAGAVVAAGPPARAAGPTDPQPPSAECEWYGTLTETHRSYTYNAPYESWQRDYHRYSYVSAPVEGEACGATLTAERTMDAQDVDPSDCTHTFTWKSRGQLSDVGYYDARLQTDGGVSTFRVYAYGDEIPVDTTVSLVSCDENSSSTGTTSFGTRIYGGECNGGGPTEATLVAGPDVQAVQSSCLVSSDSHNTTRGNVSTTLYEWSFRRVDCDRSVDSDGDTLADCEEFDLGTDPGDPDTDHDGVDDPAELALGTDPVNRDSDRDGIDDGVETNGGAAVDTDGDGTIDALDTDSDDDGVPDSSEGTQDADGDGTPDYRDDDSSGASGSFCAAEGSHSTIIDPVYAARVLVTGLPDAHLYTFGPSFLACWNGEHALLEPTTYEASVDYGFDTGALELLGFTVGYVGDSAILSAGPLGARAVAEASAQFDVSFRLIAVFDKLGVKGEIEKRAAKRLAGRLEALFRSAGYNSTALRMELIRWQTTVSYDMVRAAAKVEPWLAQRGVPDGIASTVGDKAIDAVGTVAREFRTYVGAFASTTGLYDQGAEVVADHLVGAAFAMLDPTLSFPMWDPGYRYTLHADGSLSYDDLTAYTNPFLFVEEQG